MNKVMLLGRLGQETDLRYTPSGKSVCKFSLATTKKFTKDGSKQEVTQWHNIVIWGKLAELCNQYLSKGSQVLIEGEISYRKYTAKDGVEKYMTEILADNVTFLNNSPTQKNNNNYSNNNNFENTNVQNDQNGNYKVENSSDFTSDDIPF